MLSIAHPSITILAVVVGVVPTPGARMRGADGHFSGDPGGFGCSGPPARQPQPKADSKRTIHRTRRMLSLEVAHLWRTGDHRDLRYCCTRWRVESYVLCFVKYRKSGMFVGPRYKLNA